MPFEDLASITTGGRKYNAFRLGGPDSSITPTSSGMGMLLICQQLYREVVELLYAKPIFWFYSYSELESFKSLVSTFARSNIKKTMLTLFSNNPPNEYNTAAQHLTLMPNLQTVYIWLHSALDVEMPLWGVHTTMKPFFGLRSRLTNLKSVRFEYGFSKENSFWSGLMPDTDSMVEKSLMCMGRELSVRRWKRSMRKQERKGMRKWEATNGAYRL